MEISRVSIPESAGTSLSFPFPSPNRETSETLAGAAAPREPEPTALLSLRSAGDMRHMYGGVNPNRNAFFRRSGVEAARVLGVKLAHSRAFLFPGDPREHAALVEEAMRLRGGADGVLTRNRDLVPTITEADCMPIWLLDRSSGVFGVLHSGWKGTGILRLAVLELGRRFGSPPSAVSAILGPAIGSCCYDVPEERARLFLDLYGPRAAFDDGHRWRIDLRAANIVLAERSGLGSLLSIEACTSCDPRLGSYRRQGQASFTCMAAACGHFGDRSLL